MLIKDVETKVWAGALGRIGKEGVEFDIRDKEEAVEANEGIMMRRSTTRKVPQQTRERRNNRPRCRET
eukprot:9492261-Pyramimonas_sp.AAC.1